MADNRRELLRKVLLKELLQKEASGQPQAASSGDLGIPETSPEVSQLEQSSPVTMADVQNFGTHALHAGSLGLDTHAEGLTRAAIDKASGSNQDLSDLYHQYQQQALQRTKQAAQESPSAALAGNVIGSIAPAVLTPGLGMGKMAARGIGEIAGPAAMKFALGRTGGLFGKILGRGAAMGAETAPIGAIEGAGLSEAPIGSDQFLQDVKTGAEVGGVAGAGLGLVSKGIQAIPAVQQSIAKESPFFRRAGLAYDEGKKGINLGSESARENLYKQTGKEYPKDLLDRIYQTDEFLGKKVGQSLQEAEASGQKIAASPDMTSNATKLSSMLENNPQLNIGKDLKGLVENLKSQTQGSMSPMQLKTIKDSMGEYIEQMKGDNSTLANTTRKAVMDLQGAIDKSLKTEVPAYSQAATEFSQFRSKVPESILRFGTPEDFSSVYMGNMKNSSQTLFDKAQRMLEGAKREGTGSKEAVNTFQDLAAGLKDFEKTNPEGFKQMGYASANDAIKDLGKKADMTALAQDLTGTEPRAGLKSVTAGAATGIAETSRGLFMGTANKLGMVAGSDTIKTATKPLTYMSKIFKAKDERLKGLANRLSSSESAISKRTGAALHDAIDNKGPIAKNAVLFSILQNPELRGSIKDEDINEIPDNTVK